ncbi:glycosyltransferase family 4 protein [Nocardioides perillae]|uniref:Glycosyltransferase involved in cell wall biosynthesis n=1 Tax=Nocardioides perillae TaxID=1119534 RepID=A0A7Y9RV60_9ACTN|nr:glycosyltransferase family 4 protein [Nocardioides perillae]NYG54699.1 glycosyltransferase involved in cell wall biosynthesis [Nocardioides perillae]
MPAYYRTPAYAAMAEEFAARTGGSTLVCYQVRRAARERAEWFYTADAEFPFDYYFVQPDFRYVAGRKMPAAPGGRLLLRYRPTHVFTAGWDTPLSLAASTWARWAGVHLGVWVESSPLTSKHDNLLLNAARRRFLRPATFAVVPTDASRAHVDRLAGRHVRSRLLLNPVDLGRLPDQFSEAGARVIFLGDLTRRKGFDVLLQAATVLRVRDIEVHAWGRDIEGLAAVADDVTIHGAAPLPEILPMLRSTDVLVIPSRVDPAPLTYSEALALGLRVVVSETIAYAGHASTTVGAVVSDCSSPAALIGAIEAALTSRRPDPESSREVTPRHFGTTVVDALLGSTQDAG